MVPGTYTEMAASFLPGTVGWEVGVAGNSGRVGFSVLTPYVTTHTHTHTHTHTVSTYIVFESTPQTQAGIGDTKSTASTI